jgi:nucleotide-binding universal stress UspA family protein
MKTSFAVRKTPEYIHYQSEQYSMAETVLVPIDGSPLSRQALRHALDTFPDREIVAFHVSDLFDPGAGSDTDSLYEPIAGSDEWYAQETEATEELLSEAEEIAAEYDREITTESEIGDPQRLIPEYAREQDIDHIVLGVHGREDTERQLVGRVAEKVIYRAPVPVTMIR